MTYTTTTIGQLVRWDGNPRPQAPAATRSELKASIAHKGVLVPLIVRHKSGPKSGAKRIDEVIGGDTRRDILAELLAEGKWDADRAVPVIVRDDLVGNDAEALDVALSNNIHVPVHAMDQFYAFNQMVEMGHEIQGIANAYGVSPRIVEQRLSYAKLDERARQMVKADKRDLEWAAAMTMASADEQKAMLDEIEGDPRRYLNAHDIRRRLDDELVSTSHALFDVTQVKDALVRKDLFDANGASYIKRSEFQPLQDAALADLVSARTNEGWMKVSVVSERDFDRYRYNDGVADKAVAEVVFVRHGSGAIVEHAGLTLRLEERINRMSRADEDAGEAMFGDGGSEEQAQSNLRAARIEASRDAALFEGRKTQRYVSVSRAVIIQAALMEDPRLAIAATVAGMILTAAPKPLEGKVFGDMTEMDPENPSRVIVERRLDAARQIMEDGGIDPALPYQDVVTRLLALDDAQIMTLLQVGIAKRVTTDMQRVGMMYDMVMAQDGTTLQSYWRPDRTYLGTLSKEALERLARKILPARAVSKLTGSKADYVEAMAQVIDDAHGECQRMGPTEQAQVTSWAPEALGGVQEGALFDNDEDGAAIFAAAA